MACGPSATLTRRGTSVNSAPSFVSTSVLVVLEAGSFHPRLREAMETAGLELVEAMDEP